MTDTSHIRNLVTNGHLQDAARACEDLIRTCNPPAPDILLLAASVQARLGNLANVEILCDSAMKADPGSFEATYNMAIAQQAQGKTEQAISSYQKAIELSPGHLDSHLGLAGILINSGNHDQAFQLLRKALNINEAHPRTHYLLGLIFKGRNDNKGAMQSFTRALELSPQDPAILNNLGDLAFRQGDPEQALDFFRRAVAIRPDSHIIHYNLSIILWWSNKVGEAYTHCLHAHRLSPENLPIKQQLAQIIQALPPEKLDDETWGAIPTLLQTDSIDSQWLTTAVAYHLKNTADFRRILSLAEGTGFQDPSAPVEDGLDAMLSDNLLRVSLCHLVFADSEVEYAFTWLRRTLATRMADTSHCHRTRRDLTEFLCALAVQCFLTEYAYDISDGEQAVLASLKNHLGGQHLSDYSDILSAIDKLAITSCYQPLHSLNMPIVHEIAAHTDLPDTARYMLKLLYQDHQEEENLKRHLPALGDVSDHVSRLVREQYEDSPYPRWIDVSIHTPRPIVDVLGEHFRHVRFALATGRSLAMLIAGCGTGKHAIQSASRFSDTNVTALDLSRSSLAYAARKTREYGINNIEFLHGDILSLHEYSKRFDIVESVGVLHHMRNPAEGLAILTHLLEPSGLINIGLYSTTARRHVSAARDYIARNGYGSDPDDIRKARRDIIALKHDTPVRQVSHIRDFYTMSECRDLLFHVQEHTYTIPEIETLIAGAGLEFIGFEFADRSIPARYDTLYPRDPERVNLHNWHQFEQRHPDTFIGMYIFWCRKAGS